MFRYDAIVNVQKPWICLDASEAMLGLARFSGDAKYEIEPRKTCFGDLERYVLISTSSQTYISNQKYEGSGEIMTAPQGEYEIVSWQLKVENPFKNDNNLTASLLEMIA